MGKKMTKQTPKAQAKSKPKRVKTFSVAWDDSVGIDAGVSRTEASFPDKKSAMAFAREKRKRYPWVQYAEVWVPLRIGKAIPPQLGPLVFPTLVSPTKEEVRELTAAPKAARKRRAK